MKTTLLRLLTCSACGSRFRLDSLQTEGEIMSGELVCDGCGLRHPIVRGVPRFVESGSYAGSFGTQWRWFRKVQLDSLSGTHESEEMLVRTTGLHEGDFKGRLVLDAGAGAGRFAEIAARWGAEVVAVDISEAVDAMWENIGSLPNVHVVQADVFALPLRGPIFDVVYSIGVVHHTPDPRGAFDRLAALTRDGGSLAVYVYSAYGPGNHGSDLIRKVTTRLPLPLMWALSFLAVPLYWLYRVPLLGKVLLLACPISMHRNWRWRWLDTFDWYTPRYQFKFLYPEVLRWFRDDHFVDVEADDDPIRIHGSRALLAAEGGAA